ncbi:TIGR03943 family putative permease subunit [Cohnella cholangitidis]|nr:TIGR03943 family protein [Cohnella cholangitidis]
MESYAKFGKKLVRQNVVKVTDKQFIETLTTIDLFRTAFVGKTIELSGFVYREESMGDTQFGVSRFAINCCSADASPYGMMVNYDKANTLETDEWVTVSGKLGTTAYNGIEIIQLQVDKVVKIAPPEDPYVSADLDFGLE